MGETSGPHQWRDRLTRLVPSIDDVAQEQGFSVLMSSSFFDLQHESELVGAFHRRRVSRIAHIGSRRTYRSSFEQVLAAMRPPPV